MNNRAGRFEGRRHLLLLLFTSLVMSTLLSGPANAYDNWNGSERRWPWKAFSATVLNTLPCSEDPDPNKQQNNKHCSESDPEGIDANLASGTIVYSIAAGVYINARFDGCAGYYMVIHGGHNDYYTYEHLSRFLISSGAVLAGQPIAISGGSGSCLTGPHLHFQRSSQPPFIFSPLSVTPISAEGDGFTTLSRNTSYTSDNAGIAYDSNDNSDAKMASTFNNNGGYTDVGIPGDVGAVWSPCRIQLTHGTWWRYGCTASSSFTGFVQTYKVGPKNDPQALMQWSSANSTAYLLYRGILGAYTDIVGTKDLVYSIGYPIGNRYFDSAVGFYRQSFQNGHIDFIISSSTSCTENVYYGPSNALLYTAHYCDHA